MPSIQFITYKNSFYREHFQKMGFSTGEASPSISGDNDLSEKFDFIFLEVRDDKIEESNALIERYFDKGVIICVAESVTKSLKKMILKKGISYLISENDVKKIYLFIKSIEEKSQISAGKIVIFDTKISSKTLLNDLIYAFGYEPLFVKTIDEFFDSLKHSNIQMNLLNLGSEGLDLNDFIRRCYFRSELKKIPLIAFKDMDDGVFIHEFTSGLNKLTKVVLSIEELMSFLLDLLFRKEVITQVYQVNKSYMYEDNKFYSNESLGQVYYSDEENLFSMKNVFMEENMEKINNSMNLLKKSNAKLIGLRWLKINTS